MKMAERSGVRYLRKYIWVVKKKDQGLMALFYYGESRAWHGIVSFNTPRAHLRAALLESTVYVCINK